MRKRINVQYRRKREGKTNYRKRLKLLLSRKNRAVVRKSNGNVSAQIVSYEEKGDKIVVAASSRTLIKQYGWKANRSNVPAAYLTGLLCGKKAVSAGVKEAILDMGFQTPHNQGIVYATLKGLIDGGLSIPHTEDIVPTEDAIQGKKIEEYAKKLKEDKEKYDKQFSSYIKNNVNPEEISKHFTEVKNKIMSE